MARSNQQYFDVYVVPPLDNVGWEVRVISADTFIDKIWGLTFLPKNPSTTAEPLIVISRFVDLSITQAISESGAGSITLDLDDDMWNNNLTDGSPAASLREREHLWQVYENGALRAEFLGQVDEEDLLPVEDGVMRVVRISGPGPADTLRWGVVMNMYYPGRPPLDASKPSSWQFDKVGSMGAWLQLLEAVKDRGGLRMIQPQFSATIDSAGDKWSDIPKAVDSNVTVVNTLSADVNFFPGTATLAPAAVGQVAGLTYFFDRLDAPHVTIVGHTDSDGSWSANQAMSEARAQAVAAVIRSRVPQAVLDVSGKGATQPIASNDTVAGRERNRRVVVTYPVQSDPDVLLTNSKVYTPPEGRNLLALLEELTGKNPDDASPITAEWLMRPNFRLDVRKRFGARRHTEVVFWEGSTNTVSKSRTRRRADINNYVVVWGDTGTSGAWSSRSINKFGHRESFTKMAAAYAGSQRNNIAMTTMLRGQDEDETWQLAVAPYTQGRRVFVDYNLGDWIGVSQYLGAESNRVDPYRVMAISIRVGSDNSTDLELTLQSTYESFLARLQRRLAYLLDHKEGPNIYVQDEEPILAKTGDLWTPLSDTTGEPTP